VFAIKLAVTGQITHLHMTAPTQRRIYKPLADGTWLRPRLEDFRLACCDCGLVHSVNFRLTDDGAVELQMVRQKRATKGLRARMKK
jgi:hypothetical protein